MSDRLFSHQVFYKVIPALFGEIIPRWSAKAVVSAGPDEEVEVFSVFELLEELLAESIFFFNNIKCVKVPRKSYSRNFSRPCNGPENSRITFPATYTLCGTLPNCREYLRFSIIGICNSTFPTPTSEVPLPTSEMRYRIFYLRYRTF